MLFIQLAVIFGIKHPSVVLQPDKTKSAEIRHLAKFAFKSHQTFFATSSPCHPQLNGTLGTGLATHFTQEMLQTYDFNVANPWIIMLDHPINDLVTAINDPVYFYNNFTVWEHY